MPLKGTVPLIMEHCVHLSSSHETSRRSNSPSPAFCWLSGCISQELDSQQHQN